MENEEEGNKRVGMSRILNDQPLDNYSIRLSPYHARMARLIGAGSFTEGVRISLERMSANLLNKKE